MTIHRGLSRFRAIPAIPRDLYVILCVFQKQGESPHSMSHLLLVRHGQASFLEPDYDKLSQKGELQSRLLGEYWAAHKAVFDRVYSGPRVRQRETARIAGEAYKRSGMHWPKVEILDQFDEFRAEVVMEQSLPKLVKRDAHVHELNKNFQAAAGKEERFRTFQKMFEVVITRWAGGELSVEGIEPWPEFCSRVQTGLDRLTGNGSRGQRIVIFTSGGPVGVAMQRALGLATPATLRSAWMVRNCAYSDFLFSGDRFTLGTYNAYPHLTDPEFQTYR
jgi:broad specificity phosphatase PhoE